MRGRHEKQPFELEPFEIAGFDVYGIRQDDGTLLIGAGRTRRIPEWPDSIALNGAIYTLEDVRKDINNQEWGLYV